MSSKDLRIPNFKPISLIKYDDAFYLSNILKKYDNLRKTNDFFFSLNPYHKNIYRYILELENIYRDIILTINRINGHYKISNRQLELFTKINMLNEYEQTEYDELLKYDLQGYLRLDIRILFVFINIFMDKIPKFLNSLFKPGTKPRSSSYHRYVKSLEKFNGTEIDHLKRIVNSAYIWYEDIKEIRDAYVVHQPAIHGASAYGDDYISTVLSTSKYKGIRYKPISNEYIQSIINVLEKFVKDVTNFLETHYDNIPLTIDIQ